MKPARWISDEDSAELAEYCIDRFGRRPVDGFNGPDRRAAFVVLLDDAGSVVDITAIPPAAVDHYECAASARVGRRVRAMDVHFGNCEGTPASDATEARARVGAKIAGILRGLLVPGDLIPRMLSARGLAYGAAIQGGAWKR